MLIEVQQTTASITLIKTPYRGHPSKDCDTYEDSTRATGGASPRAENADGSGWLRNV